MHFHQLDDTICAISTAPGMGAIAIIRLSGKDSIVIVNKVFSKDITSANSHTLHFGQILNEKEIIDEVVVSVYKNPKSFTGEDSVEIACHGSKFIQQEILKLLLSKGARLADPGEFSFRAFTHGKMDLSQTEAVSDLIQANSKAAHKIAMHQMRGGFGNELSSLRNQLLQFASLVELELDFSEEDVEFAERSQLTELIQLIKTKINSLLQSFKMGNAIKNGVPVVIVGAPNVGKSTLLNNLLNEEKAIVSDIAGTTRDVIEDTVILNGVEFRFIDTAGIRETKDRIELLGIERSYNQISKASIIILMFDLISDSVDKILNQINSFKKTSVNSDQQLIVVFNKSEKLTESTVKILENEGVFIAAKLGQNIDALKNELLKKVQDFSIDQEQLVVSNIRHFEVLRHCSEAANRVEEGLINKIPGDLLAQDIREITYKLGEITGVISNDELLGNIFANFCIGK